MEYLLLLVAMKIMNGISPSCGDENRNCNKKGIVRTYYLLLPLPLFLVPLRLRCLADFLVGPGPGNTVRIDIDQTLAHYFLPASKPLLYLASVNNTLILIRYLWKLATSLLPLTTESKVLQGNI